MSDSTTRPSTGATAPVLRREEERRRGRHLHAGSPLLHAGCLTDEGCDGRREAAGRVGGELLDQDDGRARRRRREEARIQLPECRARVEDDELHARGCAECRAEALGRAEEPRGNERSLVQRRPPLVVPDERQASGEEKELAEVRRDKVARSRPKAREHGGGKENQVTIAERPAVNRALSTEECCIYGRHAHVHRPHSGVRREGARAS